MQMTARSQGWAEAHQSAVMDRLRTSRLLSWPHGYSEDHRSALVASRVT